MNRNLVGRIYGRSSTTIAHFVPIRYQTWPPQAILVSDRLIGSAQNEQSLDRTIINASYQASLHLAEGFQRRRLKCEKLTDDIQWTTDDGRQVMAKAHITFGKGRHRQFLFLIGRFF
jgi:hypothetical protein